MTVTTEQRRAVDIHAVHDCVDQAIRITNGTPTSPMSVAVSLAFVLGIRFALAHPNQAGDYMGRWLKDYMNDPDMIGGNHQRMMERIVKPIWSE